MQLDRKLTDEKNRTEFGSDSCLQEENVGEEEIRGWKLTVYG